MKVIDNNFFDAVLFDTLNGLIFFTKNNKRYIRRFKTSYNTKNKDYNYAIFRLNNTFYKVKM